ncbi:MAG: TonB-dependent receptor [Deltaproteobacteria bacterium]|nr:MAG: TonB-dependent receptor [Deltaproteobacteria bacterium]
MSRGATPLSLAPALILSAIPLRLWAEQGDPSAAEAPANPAQNTPVLEAPEMIIVSPARLREPLPPSWIPASVEVIAGDAMQSAPTLPESLRHQGGLTLLDEQGNSYQPDLTLRGFTATSVTGVPQGVSVFLDGVRINEATAEELNFDLLPIDDLDRVEVIRGPSVVFGRNTLAGVLNLVTRRGKSDPAASARVGLGTYGQQDYRLQFSGAAAPFDFYFSANETREDGWRDASQARLSRAFGKVGYVRSGTDLTLSYQYVQNKIHQPGSLPPADLLADRSGNFTPGDFFEPFLNFVTLNLRQDLGRGFTLSANGFARHLSIEQFNVSMLADNSRLQARTMVAGGALQLSSDNRFFQRPNLLVAGLDYAHAAVDATVFTEKNDRTLTDCLRQAIANALDPSQACPLREVNSKVRDRQNTFAAYLQDTLQIAAGALHEGDELLLSAASRWDFIRHGITDDSPPSSGRENSSGAEVFRRFDALFGLNYNVSPKHGVYLSVAQGFRAPALFELTCASPAAICPGLQAGTAPDPALKPVRTINYEVGARTRPVRWLEARLSVFRTDVFDDIFSVSPTGTIGVYFQNVGQTRRQGLELALRAALEPALEIFANYALTEASFETDLVLATPRQTSDCSASSCLEHVSAGNRFPLVPRHRANAGIELRPSSWLWLSLSGLYVGSQRLRGDEENVAPELDGYFSLDAGARATAGGLSASLQLTNILDARYNTFGTFARNPKLPGEPVEPFRTPGRPFQVRASLSYRL